MYSHELRMAVLEVLRAVPEVQRVNHLRYWDEEIFFVVLQSKNAEVAGRTEDAVQQLLRGLEGEPQPRVRLRFLEQREPLPSSATLYQRESPLPSRA